ncbi:MAG: amidohydrolase family protein, partial [Candidatus Margulisiibacteriota bacterium]
MSIILIKGGRVIDPVSNLDGIRDVLIEDGKIKEISTKGRAPGGEAEVIDARGKIVLPGLIDMHAHLRDPGRPDKETIASGSRAA